MRATALLLVMNSMTSSGSNVENALRDPVADRIHVVRMLEPRVLPQARAGFAPQGGPALCIIPKRACNPMKLEEINRSDAFDDRGGDEASLIGAHDEYLAVRKSIGIGARAMTRLLLSMWFLLLPLIWPGSDWIGLIILSQVFLVAANLIRPANTIPRAAAAADGAVFNVNHGEESAEGRYDTV